MITARYTPWATGLTLAALVGAYTASAGIALFGGTLGVSAWLGVALLALGCAGAAPVLAQMWFRPVARWFAWGVTAGLVATWCAVVAILVAG